MSGGKPDSARAPYLVAQNGHTAAARTIRVLAFNLHAHGTDENKFRALIANDEPDVVLLTEVPANFASVAASLTPHYPHTIMERPGAPFEVILLSRWPIKQRHMDRSVATALPVLSAELCHPAAPSECVTLVGLHAARPFGRTVRSRNSQLALAARVAGAHIERPVILLGDLNVTPWAPTFARLLETGNLRDSALSRGLTATWLSRNPLLGLPIDHVLVSADISVIAWRVAADIGSDHRAVIADLAFRTP